MNILKYAVAGALGLASVGYASAASISLAPVYIGSTKVDFAPDPSGKPPSTAGLTVLNLTDAASRTSDWRHWFAATIQFTGAAGEDFRLQNFSITTTAGLTKIAADGTNDIGTNPFFYNAWNPAASGGTLFVSNADGGTPADGDLLNIGVSQTSGLKAKNNQTGEAGGLYTYAQFGGGTPVGFFALRLDTPAGTPSVSMVGAAGANFSYFTNNATGTGTAVTGSAGVTPGTFTFPEVPEPATLSLAGIAGLGLIRRRRA